MAEMEKNEYRDQRLANMEKLKGFGCKPFGQAYKRTGSLAEIRKNYKDELRVSAAGRLTTIRSMGKSIFADIRDGTGKFQIYAQKNALGDQAFDAFKLLDVGDHIGVQRSVLCDKRPGGRAACHRLHHGRLNLHEATFKEVIADLTDGHCTLVE